MGHPSSLHHNTPPPYRFRNGGRQVLLVAALGFAAIGCAPSRRASPWPGNGRNSTSMKSARSAPATWASEREMPIPPINVTARMILQATPRTLALLALLLLGAPAGETIERTRPPGPCRGPPAPALTAPNWSACRAGPSPWARRTASPDGIRMKPSAG